jgi:hypothetical protein
VGDVSVKEIVSVGAQNEPLGDVSLMWQTPKPFSVSPCSTWATHALLLC